jgi:hypothetical protein
MVTLTSGYVVGANLSFSSSLNSPHSATYSPIILSNASSRAAPPFGEAVQQLERLFSIASLFGIALFRSRSRISSTSLGKRRVEHSRLARKPRNSVPISVTRFAAFVSRSNIAA